MKRRNVRPLRIRKELVEAIKPFAELIKDMGHDEITYRDVAEVLTETYRYDPPIDSTEVSNYIRARSRGLPKGRRPKGGKES